jgi:hypothetical protein
VDVDRIELKDLKIKAQSIKEVTHIAFRFFSSIIFLLLENYVRKIGSVITSLNCATDDCS